MPPTRRVTMRAARLATSLSGASLPVFGALILRSTRRAASRRCSVQRAPSPAPSLRLPRTSASTCVATLGPTRAGCSRRRSAPRSTQPPTRPSARMDTVGFAGGAGGREGPMATTSCARTPARTSSTTWSCGSLLALGAPSWRTQTRGRPPPLACWTRRLGR